MSKNRVSIVGAGLAGSLAAIYLSRRGIGVDLYDRRPDMRSAKASAGRSINLALSRRGIHALEKVGLADKVLADIIPMYGRTLHASDGKITKQPYSSKSDEYICSVSRAGLNRLLIEEVSKGPDINFFFDHRISAIDFNERKLFFSDESGAVQHTSDVFPVIGMDGAFSGVRHELVKNNQFKCTQDYLEHSYKELTIPPGAGGSHQLEKNALHIWPRGGFMLIALPNPDGSFTGTLFLRTRGKGVESFAELYDAERARGFFEKNFSDALELMPSFSEEFFANPTSSLVTIRCAPWCFHDQAMVLGDAAHAVVPFFGQGMNCAFESVYVLDKMIEQYGDSWEEVFSATFSARKPDADALATMAIENFTEMRDLVASDDFLFRKSIERELERRYPDAFTSRYGLVTFRRFPYRFALECGKVQKGVIDQLASGARTIDSIDWKLAGELVKKSIEPMMHGAKDV